MKQILIALLLIILGIVGYGQYQQYQRFNSTEVNYTPSEAIDLDYHNQAVVLDYNEAVASLNSYVVVQWTVNDIDVRRPEDDDKLTKAAVDTYAKKMAKVKFYEALLVRSKKLKTSGITNKEIKKIELLGSEIIKNTTNTYSEKVIILFKTEARNKTLTVGDQGATVFEVQKILVKKGYNIPVDGVFKQVTFDAIKTFETQNNLYPDGKLDVLTLDYLLQ